MSQLMVWGPAGLDFYHSLMKGIGILRHYPIRIPNQMWRDWDGDWRGWGWDKWVALEDHPRTCMNFGSKADRADAIGGLYEGLVWDDRS